jgi:PAS domain S-box-containing protein
MGQRITKNINSIVKGIKAVGKGEFDYRMKLTGNDELSDIAGYFNTMAEQNHQYAQQIKNAATQWQTTFDAAHDLYLLLDKDYNIERVNQATSLFLGMPYQEILGKKCYNLIFGTDEPIPGSPFSRMLASGKHEEGEIWNEKKSVWQFFSVDPVFDEDGNLVQVIQIVRDITERKRAEEAFHEQFRQISAMFDGMNVIVHVVDPLTHELVYLNKYATSIFGSNWQGKPCHEVIGCGHPHPCALHDGNLSVDKDGVDSQNTYVYKNNITARWYQCLEKRMSWIDGRHVHITVATDITDLKNIMQMQEELISAVSHEMRTPLTAICGYTDFLLETPSAEVQTNDYLRIIQRESRRLEELLDNFLNMQRLKTRQASEIVQPLPPSPILTEAAALFTVSSPIHRIISNFPSDLPPVRIREVHMHELLNNLLSNAIKFSPKGGDIEIGARVEVDNSINFWVKDEGIGIPPDVREKVFEKFYQVESGDCRTFSGIGLGLALVKEIVNIYGGKVWVESTLGKGSTFYFSLPLA